MSEKVCLQCNAMQCRSWNQGEVNENKSWMGEGEKVRFWKVGEEDKTREAKTTLTVAKSVGE